ncbi:ArnT family glycosyltransferase [Granulicoccus phenolivorans]|uniref:ArnT family glycosyltransferase n=1 Tax=Granulicoccus phenolivorans TaxID=266854 RepID=UPI0004268AE3|nr:glycosyltransferase family 39 protein [Granulicoccus phenolivorans]
MTSIATHPGPAEAAGSPARRLAQRWWQPATLAALLVLTAALYLVNLGSSGWANSFYSAAAQAGATNWEAFFYGSLDAGNSITVDKPPAAMWLMALSVRLLGLSPFAILLPQALLGVGSVWLLVLSVRRVLGPAGAGMSRTGAHWAGLAAGLLLAVTPVATLMFRFNNPDALLVFLQVLAAYFTVRAVQRASWQWLAWAGVAVGFAFLAKTLQAFLVLPALVLAYLLCARTSWAKRIIHLLIAFVAMLVSLGWYVAIVELVPTSWRPYIGGSQTNSFLELAFGYNGLGRITGNEIGSVTPGGGGFGGGGGMWGSTGVTRLFGGVSGGMISWLIPAAVVLGLAALVLTFRKVQPLTGDPVAGQPAPAALQRAGLIVYGGWLAVTALTFSFMAGIYHDYYTVALAPAIAATTVLGFVICWRHRDLRWPRIVIAAALLLTAGWGIALAAKAGGIYLGVSIAAAVLGVGAAVVLLLAPRMPATLTAVAVVAALLAGAAGPTAYALNTAATPHNGSIVTAGPVTSGPGGRGGFGRMGEDGRDRLDDGTGQRGQFPNGMQPPNGMPAPNGMQAPNGMPAPNGLPDGTTADAPNPGGGGGGLLEGATVSAEMKQALLANADSYTWVAATTGSQNAASYQLATNRAVMAIGGFNGSDPAPTLAQFQQYVEQGRIHYYISGGERGGRMGQNGGSSAASEISSWVAAHYTATTIGSVTVYDLTQAAH